MPPRERSRHIFTTGTRLDDIGEEELFLTEREPYGYKQRDDNRARVVDSGDTLYTLAGRFFRRLPRPAGLWWVVADYQPQPIHDPTIQLSVGSIVVIPAERVVDEEIFSEDRRITG